MGDDPDDTYGKGAPIGKGGAFGGKGMPFGKGGHLQVGKGGGLNPADFAGVDARYGRHQFPEGSGQVLGSGDGGTAGTAGGLALVEAGGARAGDEPSVSAGCAAREARLAA